MLPRSLTARLMMAAMIGMLAATAAGVTLTSALIWPSSPTRMLRAELAEEVERIEEDLRVDAAGKVHVAFKQETANLYDAMPKDVAYVVYDRNGQILAQSVSGPVLTALLSMQPETTSMSIRSGDVDLPLQVTQQRISHGDRTFIVRVARSDRLTTTLNDHTGEVFLSAALATILVALAVFTVVVYLTVRWMVRPLRRTSAVAARIGPRNLATRLRTDGLPTELVPLIEAFNAALVRLETGFRVQQEFLASAAHELKTPLALLQAEIELGGAGNTDYLLRDTALMARIVHQLLHLAEVSEGHNYTFASVDLQTEVREAIEYLKRLADQRSVHVELDADEEPTIVVADRGAVFVLIKNLLENAIHHSPAGSVVHVRVGAEGLSVRDEGKGVAEKDEPFLFQRFWRAEAAESEGAGLGLTICKEICQAHGWQIHHEAPRDATGACFVVSMDQNDASTESPARATRSLTSGSAPLTPTPPASRPARWMGNPPESNASHSG